MQRIHSLWREAFLNLLFLSLLAIPGGGCGGGTSGGGTAGSTDFEGTLAGDGGETGTISVTVETDVAALKAQTSGDVAATGVCIFVGQPPVDLSGTFTPSSGDLSLTGDGTTFTGNISGGEVSGTFSNPTTGLSGGFSGLDSSDSTVTTYCGTFSGGGDEGIFNVQVDSSGNLSGTAICTAGEGCNAVDLSGTVSGNSISGQSSEGNSFSGTIAGNDVSGTFEVTGGGTGTFSGSTGACE